MANDPTFEDEIDAFVGMQLRSLRLRRGLSMVELAEKISVTRQQVHKYETGRNRLPLSSLCRISDALDVPVGYFLDRKHGSLDSKTMEAAFMMQSLPDDPRDLIVGLIKMFHDLSFREN